MQPRPEIGVIIVTHNSGDVLDECLRHLAGGSGRSPSDKLSVVIVDSGSSDQRLVQGAGREHGLKVVILGANRGYGAACNEGVAVLGAADWFILMNPDVRISGPAIEGLVAIGKARNLACIGPLLSDGSGRVIESWRRLPMPPWRRRRKGWRLDDDIIRSEMVSGAVIAFDAAAFRAVGGFDEDFFLYAEEIDIERRLHDCGFNIGVALAVSAVHLSASSSSNVSDRWRRTERFVGHMRYMDKHFGPWARALSYVRSGLQIALDGRLRPVGESYRQLHSGYQTIVSKDRGSRE